MRPSLLASAAVLSLSFGLPAHALEAEAVWADWSAWLRAQEGTKVPQPRIERDTVVVEGLEMGQAELRVVIPEMHLTQQGSRVAVTFPQPITYTGEEGAEGSIDLSAFSAELSDASRPGLLGRVAGNFEGDIEIEGSVNVPHQGPVAFSGEILGVEAELAQGSSGGRAGFTVETDSSKFEASGGENTDFVFALNNENGPASMEVDIENFATLAKGDPLAAFTQGTNITIAIRQEEGVYAAAQGNGETMEEQTSAWEEARLDIALDRDGLSYAASAEGVQTSSTLPEGQGALEMEITQMGASFAMPLFARKSAQQVRFGLELLGVELSGSGAFWGPEMAKLAQDPISLTIAGEGDIELGSNLLPETVDATPPETIHGRALEARLTEMNIEGLGGRAQATGSLEFAGDTFENTEPGRGSMTVVVENANAVFNTLQAVGLMDESMRQQAEMMLRAFGKPGEMENQTFVIERDAQGGLSINGNKL